MTMDQLCRLATGRTTDLFAADLRARRAEIAERITDSRVLVIGGAGSIGASTVKALSDFRPKSLHVVDLSENNLAEMVRDLRSSESGLNVPDFRALPIDFGSPIMRRFLVESGPYDYVLNFAALKHVRSEKDEFSLLQMLDTNIVKPARLLGWLRETGAPRAYFCVSTDKAANPVNLMGASKRLMEHMVFSCEVVGGLESRVTSARFANVAFSDGSLLQSWIRRLEKQQPLAAPASTRRFFISLEESGLICLLAAMCAPDRHILIPRLDPSEDLHELDVIAREFLCAHGYKPRIYGDENTARAGVAKDIAAGRYPLLITALDTQGEKPYEEFVGAGEKSVEVGMQDLLAVGYRPTAPGAVARFVEMATEFVTSDSVSVGKEQIISEISKVVPEFHHIESKKSLDERM